MSTLLHGDCRLVLPTLAENSIDSVVCDPPYELGFMGRSWDSTGVAFEVPMWKQVLRVAKPGARLLAFGGTRTFHRLTCAIEDAGWEIRDCLMWLYGQGFPKSHNGEWGGTALKPGWEPIILARKPLSGTVAETFAEHGTGALNIDASRIYTDWSERPESWKASGHSAKPGAEKIAAPPGTGINCHPAGRWPANVLLTHAEDCERVGTKRVKGAAPAGPAAGSRAHGAVFAQDTFTKGMNNGSRVQHVDADGTEEVEAWDCVEGCSVRTLDDQSGTSKDGVAVQRNRDGGVHNSILGAMRKPAGEDVTFGTKGGASRFFYCGKATKRDRGEGNKHPTVKPTKLLEYLIPLITPPRGVVLDHFMGSGSTGVAARRHGFGFVGIELGEAHLATATRRIREVDPLLARSA
jgi:site-specific DNA-methyltransferase (adenine-specific)